MNFLTTLISLIVFPFCIVMFSISPVIIWKITEMLNAKKKAEQEEKEQNMSEELQKLLEQHDAEVRAKAIDEFLEELLKIMYFSPCGKINLELLAERLKEGEEQ